MECQVSKKTWHLICWSLKEGNDTQEITDKVTDEEKEEAEVKKKGGEEGEEEEEEKEEEEEEEVEEEEEEEEEEKKITWRVKMATFFLSSF